ncbi:resolvase [Helicobacter sp. MIT 03-1614]|uniref:Resolvase n=4 Tax=Helicobacter typhlonius TaxID=76936 RepID=A0A099UE26_9HELI|nr:MULTISPECIES: recombinase family protein [Helicobacter]HCD72854.1 resolvase [Helicobacter sp.]TLD79244.1 resolvase [Helicobacter typhlonius]TLD86941.1 resolvase [Helicobacter sp. MIT 03-1614]TLD89426.1 resolvase [Helicobacter sp. MIT 03-1616]CUU40595.1 Site-specific recombinase, resolvase family [Helicobacter typhlonius]
MNLAYIRISTNKQDTQTQKLQIQEYCRINDIHIDKFIEIEQSSKKSQEIRKIGELKTKLNRGDLLIVVELSRLGRSMLEVMNLVLELSNNGVQMIFLRQPELSTFNSAYAKLLLAIYAYIDETEREFISQRTKAGLEKAMANGKKLGRPKGSFSSEYDKDIDKIKILLNRGESKRQVWQKLGYTHKTLKSFTNFLKSRKII